MTSYDWRTVFPEHDRAVYESAGFGGTLEPGRRAALLVIDVVESFAGAADRDVFESISEYRTSCGPAGEAAIRAIASLLEVARSSGTPVVYTKGSVENKFHSGDSVKGTSPESVAKIYGAPILSAIAPREDEFVFEKTKASAFFASPLPSYFTRMGVDTLLICGTTTSGCVRASTTDAFSYGYRTFVVEDGVFDRSEMSNAVNLFELNAKYASVIGADRAREILRDSA
jgi:nicotinamidase-related amidase